MELKEEAMQTETQIEAYLVFFFTVLREIKGILNCYDIWSTKLSEIEMYDFHRHTEEGNQENEIVINRNED
jgi:hypothetical protein